LLGVKTDVDKKEGKIKKLAKGEILMVFILCLFDCGHIHTHTQRERERERERENDVDDEICMSQVNIGSTSTGARILQVPSRANF